MKSFLSTIIFSLVIFFNIYKPSSFASAPSFTLNKTSYSFSSTLDLNYIYPASPLLEITNTGTKEMYWQSYGLNCTYLYTNPANGSIAAGATQKVEVQIVTSGLEKGKEYNTGSVTIEAAEKKGSTPTVKKDVSVKFKTSGQTNNEPTIKISYPSESNYYVFDPKIDITGECADKDGDLRRITVFVNEIEVTPCINISGSKYNFKKKIDLEPKKNKITFKVEDTTTGNAEITIYVTYSKPNTPSPISPTNNEQINSLTPTFSWSSFSYPNNSAIQDGYQIVVRYDKIDDPSENIVYDTGFIADLTGSSHTYQPGKFTKTDDPDAMNNKTQVSNELQWGKHYHWHVRYKDSFGKWSDWSSDPVSGGTLQSFATPSTMDVTLNGIVSNSKSNKPVPGARIVLDGHEAFSDKNGEYTIKLSYDLVAYAWLDFNVYANGYTDYYSQVGFSSPELNTYNFNVIMEPVYASLSYDGLTISDDNVGLSSGNCNGTPDAGETIELYPRIVNQKKGSLATRITCVLTTKDKKLLMVTSKVSYPDIKGEESKLPSSPFVFKLPEGYSGMPAFEITYDYEDTAGAKYSGGPDTIALSAVTSTGSIKVKVTNQESDAIRSAEIYVNDEIKGVTDSNGKLTITNMEMGDYAVKAKDIDGHESDYLPKVNISRNGEVEEVNLKIYKNILRNISFTSNLNVVIGKEIELPLESEYSLIDPGNLCITIFDDNGTKKAFKNKVVNKNEAGIFSTDFKFESPPNIGDFKYTIQVDFNPSNSYPSISRSSSLNLKTIDSQQVIQKVELVDIRNGVVHDIGSTIAKCESGRYMVKVTTLKDTTVTWNSTKSDKGQEKLVNKSFTPIGGEQNTYFCYLDENDVFWGGSADNEAGYANSVILSESGSDKLYTFNIGELGNTSNVDALSYVSYALVPLWEFFTKPGASSMWADSIANNWQQIEGTLALPNPTGVTIINENGYSINVKLLESSSIGKGYTKKAIYPEIKIVYKVLDKVSGQMVDISRDFIPITTSGINWNRFTTDANYVADIFRQWELHFHIRNGTYWETALHITFEDLPGFVLRTIESSGISKISERIFTKKITKSTPDYYFPELLSHEEFVTTAEISNELTTSDLLIMKSKPLGYITDPSKIKDFLTNDLVDTFAKETKLIPGSEAFGVMNGYAKEFTSWLNGSPMTKRWIPFFESKAPTVEMIGKYGSSALKGVGYVATLYIVYDAYTILTDKNLSWAEAADKFVEEALCFGAGYLAFNTSVAAIEFAPVTYFSSLIAIPIVIKGADVVCDLDIPIKEVVENGEGYYYQLSDSLSVKLSDFNNAIEQLITISEYDNSKSSSKISAFNIQDEFGNFIVTMFDRVNKSIFNFGKYYNGEEAPLADNPEVYSIQLSNAAFVKEGDKPWSKIETVAYDDGTTHLVKHSVEPSGEELKHKKILNNSDVEVKVSPGKQVSTVLFLPNNEENDRNYSLTITNSAYTGKKWTAEFVGGVTKIDSFSIGSKRARTKTILITASKDALSSDAPVVFEVKILSGSGDKTIKITAVVDDSCPQTKITTLRNNQVVSGSVDIDASVADDSTIVTEVKIDGKTVANELPFKWDTTSALAPITTGSKATKAQSFGVSTVSAQSSETPPSEHTIEVVATDQAGNTASDSVKVIVDNSQFADHSLAPVIENFTATPQIGPSSLDVKFLASASDQDNDIKLETCDFDGDGVIDWECDHSKVYANDPHNDMKFTYNNPGDYTAKYNVEDSNGHLVSRELKIEAYPIKSVRTTWEGTLDKLSIVLSDTCLPVDSILALNGSNGDVIGLVYEYKVGLGAYMGQKVKVTGAIPDFSSKHAFGYDVMYVTKVEPVVNHKPVLAFISDQNGKEGAILEFNILATDEDGNAIAYSIQNTPEGASLNSTTGAFSWKPEFGQAGDYSVTFHVSDGELSDEKAVNIKIEKSNRAPVLDVIGDKTTDENKILTFTINAADPDEDNLTYLVSNLPEGSSFDPASRIFTWTPGYDQAKSYPNIHFEVSDGMYTDLENITINVINVNRAPVLDSMGDKTGNENEKLTFTLRATDLDGDKITFSSSNLPKGAILDGDTGLFDWTPEYGQKGAYDLTFKASDGVSADEKTIKITVLHTNRPPVLNPIGNQVINENDNLSFTISATDPDDDILTFSVSNLPNGATFDTTTGFFSWVPTFDQSGIYKDIHFEVSDGFAVDVEQITITVNKINRPPVLDLIGDQSIDENNKLTFTVNAADPDEDNLTYLASNLPEGSSFDSETRLFSWVPTFDQSGKYKNIHFQVSDGTVSDAENIIIAVNNINRVPAIVPIGNKEVKEGRSLEFAVVATDQDKEDKVTYSCSNLPSGANFDKTTGKFSWKPNIKQASTYYPSFTATDGKGYSAPENLTIIVTANSTPQFKELPTVVYLTTDSPCELHAQASDVDGDTLAYFISGNPLGSNLDSITGIFKWTPTFADEGKSYVVTFKVNDGLVETKQDVTMSVAAKIVDIFTSNITKSTSIVKIKNKVKFSTVINCSGNKDSGSFGVAWMIDGKVISRKIIDNLIPGDIKKISYIWTPSKKGKHTIKVSVDNDRKVLESNEFNNEKEIKVKVK